MAGEWTPAHLGDVTDLLTGFPFKSERYVDESSAPRLLRGDNVAQGELRWDGAKRWPIDAADDIALYQLREGDVILAMDRPWIEAGLKYASVRRSDLPALLVQRVARLRGTKRLDTGFLKHLIGCRAFTDHVLAVQTGTAVPHISGGQIKSFEFLLPPLPEQRAIAHILGTLDDKIEMNRRMNETLEAMARALFKSWFVDFDPVRAKAEGRDPGLPQPLADLFPARLVDSELGEIPEGWEIKRLSDLCSTQYGYTASAVAEHVGPKFLRVKDINKRNWIEWADVPYCAIEAEVRAFYALQIGDLVVARMADPGKSAIIEERVDAVFASYLVRLKTESLAHSYYVYGFLKSNIYAEYAEGAKSGSVQANMNAKVIAGVSLVVPPVTVMDQFLGAVLPLRRRLSAGVRETRALAALRDTLLPKLISGELRLWNVERFIGSLA
jgi:type I restriction enzyme S subunit